jgi:hypothetical protein
MIETVLFLAKALMMTAYPVGEIRRPFTLERWPEAIDALA